MKGRIRSLPPGPPHEGSHLPAPWVLPILEPAGSDSALDEVIL
jgi:hypothetical protein